MQKQRWAIIGGGVSGCFLSHLLSSDSHIEVSIFEKSRGLGGRCSVRRHNEYGSFNHGAQFLTNKNIQLSAYFSKLTEQNLIQSFHAPIGYRDSIGSISSAIPVKRFVGKPHMNSFLKKWSEGANIHTEFKVVSIDKQDLGWCIKEESGKKYGEFDACVLSIPFPQGIDLWTKNSSIPISKPQLFPCWSLMVVSTKVQCKFSTSFVRNGPISWFDSHLIDNQKQKWGIQASPEWSMSHVNTDQAVVQEILLKELESLLGEDLQVEYKNCHRWLYASGKNNGSADAIWDADRCIGYVGDWLCEGRIEGAMTSALNLFQNASHQI